MLSLLWLCTSSHAQLLPPGILFQFTHSPLSTRTQNESSLGLGTNIRPHTLYVPLSSTVNEYVKCWVVSAVGLGADSNSFFTVRYFPSETAEFSIMFSFHLFEAFCFEPAFGCVIIYTLTVNARRRSPVVVGYCGAMCFSQF